MTDRERHKPHRIYVVFMAVEFGAISYPRPKQ